MYAAYIYIYRYSSSRGAPSHAPPTTMVSIAARDCIYIYICICICIYLYLSIYRSIDLSIYIYFLTWGAVTRAAHDHCLDCRAGLQVLRDKALDRVGEVGVEVVICRDLHRGSRGCIHIRRYFFVLLSILHIMQLAPHTLSAELKNRHGAKGAGAWPEDQTLFFYNIYTDMWLCV